MADKFYHEFTVGFNVWYVVAPIMVVIMCLVGMANVKSMKKNRKDGSGKYWVIRRAFNDSLYKLCAAVLTVVFAAMFTVESGNGVIQYVINHLSASDAAVYGDLAFVFFILPAVAAVFYGIMMLFANVGEILQAKKLEKQIQKYFGSTAAANAMHYFDWCNEQTRRHKAEKKGQHHKKTVARIEAQNESSGNVIPLRKTI